MLDEDLPPVYFTSSPESLSVNNEESQNSNSTSKIPHYEPSLKESTEIDNQLQIGLERSDSKDSEDLGTLIEDVEALKVEQEPELPGKPQAEELIQKFIQDFTEYDTSFLKQYLEMLKNNNQTAIEDATNNIISSIEEVVKQQSLNQGEWSEQVLVILLGWLCTAVLSLTHPHVQPSYKVLSELQTHTTIKVRVRVACACWRQLSAAQLMELADVTTAPGGLAAPGGLSETEGGAGGTLSDLLLRAALCRLQPEPAEPHWAGGRLEGAEVTAGVTAAWAHADSGARSLLTRVAMRARAAGRLPALPAALRSVARAGAASGRQPETLRVLVDVSKLALLFRGDDEAKKRLGAGRRRRPGYRPAAPGPGACSLSSGSESAAPHSARSYDPAPRHLRAQEGVSAGREGSPGAGGTHPAPSSASRAAGCSSDTTARRPPPARAAPAASAPPTPRPRHLHTHIDTDENVLSQTTVQF